MTRERTWNCHRSSTFTRREPLIPHAIMSSSSDIERAISNVRESFDTAAMEAEKMSEQAKREVHEALDELEARIEELRRN